MIVVRTKSSGDTQAVAEVVGSFLQPGDVILASGDLGAGKTTFTKGIGVALGITDPITSPTFVLMCQYEGRLRLYHADMYRLDQMQEVIDLGMSELFDEGAVAMIEWGEAAAPVISNDYLAIRLRMGEGDDDREIEFESVGSSWAARESAMELAMEQWIRGDK